MSKLHYGIPVYQELFDQRTSILLFSFLRDIISYTDSGPCVCLELTTILCWCAVNKPFTFTTWHLTIDGPYDYSLPILQWSHNSRTWDAFLRPLSLPMVTPPLPTNAFGITEDRDEVGRESLNDVIDHPPVGDGPHAAAAIGPPRESNEYGPVSGCFKCLSTSKTIFKLKLAHKSMWCRLTIFNDIETMRRKHPPRTNWNREQIYEWKKVKFIWFDFFCHDST